MHIFLTGASGFVGSYVLRALLAAGHSARCLVRDLDLKRAAENKKVEYVRGDILKPKTLTGLARGCDAVIHLVGIIDEQPDKGITFEAVHFRGTKHVVEEARDAEIEHFVLMSANGARQNGVSAYQRTKWKAEQFVQQAGFQHWTILRPSIIFGDPGDNHPEFATRLARTLIKPFPVLPVFDGGTSRIQPISVEEVASAFAQTLTNRKTDKKIYCVAGKEAITFSEILDRITRSLGEEPKLKIPHPTWLARPAIQVAGRFNLLPISIDQFEMLIEDNTCDSTAFYRDFDVTFKPFTVENLDYVKKRS